MPQLFTIVLSSLLFIIPLQTHVDAGEACYTSSFPTLMYHHIREYSDDKKTNDISVSPEEFEAQIRFLSQKWYRSITPRDIHQNFVPCRSVMIMFDDGYYDVSTNALPIMNKYRYRGVISLILSRLDESDYLTGKDVIKMQNLDWEVANHTWDHPILRLKSEPELNRQINDSKRDLEKWFSIVEWVRAFVYPGGFYDAQSLDALRASSHMYGFNTHHGLSDLTKSHLELNRINMLPGTTPEKLETIIRHLEPISQQNTAPPVPSL